MRCGHPGDWKDYLECSAKVKVVNWEETEEQVNEETDLFPLSTNGVIENRSCLHSGWSSVGLRVFEIVELKRHATLVEVVLDSETFRVAL